MTTTTPWTRAAGAGMGAALWLLAARGMAQQEAPIVLSWHAPPECPTQPQVLARIHQRLGGAPAEGRSRLVATATAAQRAEGGYRVQLRTDLGGIEGERALEAESCDALADAAALVLALTFDPEAVAAAQPAPAPAPAPQPAALPAPSVSPGVPPQPPAPPPPVVPPGRVVPPPPISPTERAWRIALHATADLSVGALPAFGVGVNGGVALIWSRAHLALAGAVFPSRAATLAGQTDVGGDVWLALGSAWGGYVVLEEPVSITPGLGLEIGVMSANGFGVPRRDPGAGLWLTPFASAAGFLPIALPLGLRLELALGIPIFRPPFVLEGIGTVHRAAPVVFRASLGPELRF